MSLALAHPASPPDPLRPEPMPDGMGRRSLALSAALHLTLVGIVILGLPTLFHPPPSQEMPIAVQLVTMGPETRATHPNPQMPQREAKPDLPIPGPPGPKPKPQTAPPEPTPPPSAAAAPPVPMPPPLPQAKPAPPPPPPPVPALKPAPPPPPPKPVEKADTPLPTAQPPRQMAREEARAEARKYDPGQFNALLRNLAAKDTPAAPDAPPQDTQVASGAPSSQPRAPLGSQLSASELDMIREQIARCWNIPAGARDAKDLVVELRVEVGPDGMVQQATIVDQARLAGDPVFRAAANSARRALFNPLCRPLRLPPDKYEAWKDMDLVFNPKDLL